MASMPIFLLLAAIALPAAEDRYAPRPGYDRCIDASEGITVNMLDCIGVEYDYQDGLLNSAYKRAMARLNPSQQATLRNSEREWLRAREGKCWAEVVKDGNDGGTLGTVQRNTCMLFDLIARKVYLEDYRP